MRLNAAFRLTYGGDALDAGTMDVRDLAPSLLALSDLVEATSDALYGGSLEPSVQVRASLRNASFSVELVIVGTFVQRLFHSAEGVAALLAVIGALKGGIAARKKIRGRRIIRVESRENAEVVIILDDNDTLNVDTHTARFLGDKRAAEAMGKVLEPLRREGISHVTFGEKEDTDTTVNKDELPFFETPSAEPKILVDEIRKMVFSLISVTFRDDNKWRLSDGETTFFVAMEDERFLKRVDDGETFSKGDQLVCDVRVMQEDVDGALKTSYTVLRVFDHRRRPAQQTLFPEPPLSDER